MNGVFIMMYGQLLPSGCLTDIRDFIIQPNVNLPIQGDLVYRVRGHFYDILGHTCRHNLTL